MKVRRMVVAVDFTEPSLAAARWAVQNIGAGAELELLHVIALPEPPAMLRGRFAPSEQLRRTAVEGARVRLQLLGEALDVPGFRIEVRVGDPAREIADAASRFEADLVILGPHQARGRAWEMLGGTADDLVRLMPVPTLLAPANASERTKHVLASVDGGRLTREVLQTAAAIARRAGAKLTILHVHDAAVYATLSAVHSGDQSAIRADALAETLFLLEGPMRAAGVDTETTSIVTEFGEARSEIIAAVHRLGADMLVMGTHGLGRARIRHALGSVASSILRRAPVPVLVVNGEPPSAGGSRPLDDAPTHRNEYVPWH